MNDKLIIWDWNGTLLNDIDACITSINQMLAKRGMKQLEKNHYKEIFTFPVQDYYKKIGFDFKDESFEKLSVEYIDLYKKNSKYSPLQQGVNEALEFFKAIGYKQVILSASEQKALEKQVEEKGIYSFFESVIGLNNIHAKSKKQNALNFIESNNSYKTMVLIGDTFHDHEVAEAIQSRCILVRNGHQELTGFKLNGETQLINSLENIKDMFNEI